MESSVNLKKNIYTKGHSEYYALKYWLGGRVTETLKEILPDWAWEELAQGIIDTLDVALYLKTDQNDFDVVVKDEDGVAFSRSFSLVWLLSKEVENFTIEKNDKGVVFSIKEDPLKKAYMPTPFMCSGCKTVTMTPEEDGYEQGFCPECYKRLKNPEPPPPDDQQ